ncbi:hypothetical protein GCM10012289_09380 [Nonomuraea cavernae]|uniref:Uncharacterized protein n=1 Tax=Nonomuraea cavernae TaxID=2045107 RepID=A0A917YSM9_9ACTN|nr:hypothetical protein GCM10012289_09380 [Nonomuraea cavernae]
MEGNPTPARFPRLPRADAGPRRGRVVMGKAPSHLGDRGLPAMRVSERLRQDQLSGGSQSMRAVVNVQHARIQRRERANMQALWHACSTLTRSICTVVKYRKQAPDKACR